MVPRYGVGNEAPDPLIEYPGTRSTLTFRTVPNLPSGVLPVAGVPQIPTLRDFPCFELELDSTLKRKVVRQRAWLIFELDHASIAWTIVPQVLEQYLGAAGKLDYDADVVVNQIPFTSLYETEWTPANGSRWTEHASVALLQITPRASSLPPLDPPFGLWLPRVHHRAGSFDVIVAKGRRRNIAL